MSTDTSRKPVYAKKSQSHRIVSRPGGQWQLQSNTGESSREADAWRDASRATTRDSALIQLERAAR
jgi:hypothetical protein